jgi:methoxymalonate biosynthesis acyl carrier protein
MNEVKPRIREFFYSFFKNVDLQDDSDIFSLGFVNSLFAMQLVVFLEKEFQIIIDNDDLDFDNFTNINSIAGLIERKREMLISI